MLTSFFIEILAKTTFRLIPRKRESQNALKILNSCLLQPAACWRRNTVITSPGAFSKISYWSLDMERCFDYKEKEGSGQLIIRLFLNLISGGL